MGKRTRFVARHATAAAAGAICALVYVELRDLWRWLENEKLEKDLLEPS